MPAGGEDPEGIAPFLPPAAGRETSSRRVELSGSHQGVQRRPQGGWTLLEALATVILMSVSLVALILAFSSLTILSTRNRYHVQAGNEATSVTETVQRLAYLPCDGGSYSLPPVAPGFTASIEKVEYLQNRTDNPPTFVTPDCPLVSGAPTDYGIQRLTIRVISSNVSGISERVVLSKRASTCPATMPTVPGQSC